MKNSYLTDPVSLFARCRFRRFLAAMLTLSMVFSAAPMAELSAYAAETDNNEQILSTYGNDVSFTEVSVSTAEDLKTYLQSSGDYKISVIDDLSYRIGKKGDVTCDIPEYWCRLGSGIKVVDLKNHDISLYCDSKNSTSKSMYGATVFSIPSGAHFVLNDSVGNGEINYNAMLKEAYDNVDVRNIFTVEGGKLTVNNGRVIAGRRSDKHIIDLSYAFLQVLGFGIVIQSGDVVLNGGRVEGRGGVGSIKYAAIRANGGNLTINDCEVCGYGDADALQVNGGSIAIKSGYFNTYKNDYKSYTYRNTVRNAEKGYIGIPGSAFSHDPNLEKTVVWRDSKGEMSAVDVAGGGVKNITNRVEVSPRNVSAAAQYSYDGKNWNNITSSTVINWDTQSNLKFRCFDENYFTKLNTYDLATHYYPEYNAAISLSPGGEAISSDLSAMRNNSSNHSTNGYPYTDEQTAFDLYNYKSETSALENGKTYYLQLSGTEYFKGAHTYKRIVSPSSNIQIKITLPTELPTLNVDYDWELSDSGTINITPKGDATRAYLDNLRALGTIGSYSAEVDYYNKSGTKTTYSYGSNFIGLFGHSDLKRGESQMTLRVKIVKGTQSKTFTCPKTVIFPPNFTANKTTENDAIYFYPSASDRSVKFTADGGTSAKIFWVRNGSKITGATGLTYTVNDAATAPGWYSLGYTYDGTDYKGKQSIYVGMKEGTRSVSISKSSSTCTITSDTSSTPTFTVTASGTGWGTISRYRWEVVSVADGTPTYTRYRNFTTNKATLAEIFGWTSRTTYFCEGDYVLQCHVKDELGNEQTSSTVTVTVKRPVSDLTVFCNNEDVTGKFIAFGKADETATLSVEFQPENAVATSSTFFSSSDTSICTVTQSGVIQAKKAGTANIIVTNGSISKTVTIYVPKTEYSLTIPESYLDAVPGDVIYQGAIPVSSNEDFTAELKWFRKSGSYYNEVNEGDVFQGECVYEPEVIIYPKSGVVYPSVKEENRDMWDILYGNIDITVNGTTYYGLGQSYYNYMTAAPVSSGDSRYDYIYLYLDPTEKLVDTRDEYLSLAEYEVEIPVDGQTAKDPGKEPQLTVNFLTEGIKYGGDSIKEITDVSTIKDNTVANDAVIDFPEGGVFEEGKTYRYALWLLTDSSYTTSEGGVVRFTDSTSTYCSGMRTITNTDYASSGLLISYIYFTVPEDENIILGDVDRDGDVDNADAALYLKYLSGDTAYRFTASQLKRADVNSDGNYDLLDVIAILGKIS